MLSNIPVRARLRGAATMRVSHSVLRNLFSGSSVVLVDILSSCSRLLPRQWQLIVAQGFIPGIRLVCMDIDRAIRMVSRRNTAEVETGRG